MLVYLYILTSINFFDILINSIHFLLKLNLKESQDLTQVHKKRKKGGILGFEQVGMPFCKETHVRLLLLKPVSINTAPRYLALPGNLSDRTEGAVERYLRKKNKHFQDHQKLEWH